MMLKWLKARRLRNLREQLAIINAEIACEAQTERDTGELYPMSRVTNARELARILFRIAELEKP